MANIFISHAVKDKKIVDSFVDLILNAGLSVPITQIFCVSTDGAKIKSGDDWRDSIRENLLSAKVTILIITPNYKESEVCLNEMGAAWITGAHVLPLIVEPINYKTVGVIQEPKQIEKLLEEQDLDRIKDVIQEKLDIPASHIKSDRWTLKKSEFLSKVKKYLSANAFQVPMDRNAFDRILEDRLNLQKLVDNLIAEKGELEELVEDLKKAKNKEEVKKIIKKHSSNSDYEEFVLVAEKIKKQLSKFTPIVHGIIFIEYSKKNISINSDNFREDIGEAIAEDFITDDLDVDWNTTSEMRNTKKLLNELSEIMGRNLDDNFEESFESDYKAPLKLENKTFWENVFDATVWF